MSEQSRPQFIGPRVVEPPALPKFCEFAQARQFAAGQYHWIVCEHHDSRGAALVFLGPGVARRVRSYPADWHTLPDDALYVLSWSA
jgi:hypothetical protein